MAGPRPRRSLPRPSSGLLPALQPSVQALVVITGDTPTPLPTDIGQVASAELYNHTAESISGSLLVLLGRFDLIDFEELGFLTGTVTPDQQELIGASVGIARDFNNTVDEALASLRSIVPPSSCAAFHNAFVEYLDNMASVLRQWALDMGTLADTRTGAPSQEQFDRLKADYSQALEQREAVVEGAASCE